MEDNRLNKKLIRQVKRSVKKRGPYAKQACMMALAALKPRIGPKEVNKLIQKYNLDSEFGIQMEKEEETMAKGLTVKTVKLKKGAEFINKSTGNSSEVKKEVTLEALFKDFSKKPVDLSKVTIELTEKGNLKVKVGETVYMVRKKEFEIIEAEKEEKEGDDDDDMVPVKPKKKAKDEDEEDDEDEAEADEDDEDEEDEKSKKKKKDEDEDEEDEAEGDEDEDDEDEKPKKKKAKDEDEEDDEEDEDEEPKKKKKSKDEDEDEEEEKEGKDMNQLAESLGEDFNSWPDKAKAKTKEDKFKAKLKIQILRARKLKAKIDKIDERFGRMFKRYFRKELRKHYGKNWREQNFSEVFESFLSL